jgi:glucose repression regulatory protein TUP1
MPIDLDPATVPPEFLKEGHDWLAVFNPDVRRVMDINLSCKFTHDKSVNVAYILRILLRRLHFRVVCCVRFSPDRTRLAVGLDNMVCLYDVTTRRQDMCALSL